MPKKLLTALAAVLAVAALSVVPAAAQAAPHWYVNGTKVAEGEKVPVIEWGALSFGSEPNPGDWLTCEFDGGGFVENPVGGGAGSGQTTRFASWDCVTNECPEGAIEGLEKEYEVIVPPQDLPWPDELIGSSPKFRLNFTKVVLELGCVLHPLTKAEAGEGGPRTATGEAGENEQKALSPFVKCETTSAHAEYTWDPEVHNGINAGPSQSTLIFNQSPGTGLSCDGGKVTGENSQQLHFMGYDNSELITVKNP